MPIVGYEGLYEISNTGSVKVLPRLKINGTGSCIRKEAIRKPSTHKLGYKLITLIKGGKPKTLSVHRLVAMHFIPNPNNLPVVNHIDFNPSNNCVSNLEWVTAKENVAHNWRNNRIDITKQHSNRKHVIDENSGQVYYSIAKAAKAINMDTSVLSLRLNGIKPNTTNLNFLTK